MEIFCFYLGILYAYTWNHYLTIALLLFFYLTPKWQIVLFFFLGMGIAWFHQWQNYPQQLPKQEVIQRATIEGNIASIPISTPYKTQFVLALTQFNSHDAQGLIKLAWYNHPPPIQLGQHWRLEVKLKKPRNFFNPGSFDYVSSLRRHHIWWTGYVRNKGLLLKENTAFLNWLNLRETLGNKLTQLAPDMETAGIIEALTLNLTRYISQEQWELFRRTGTIHLFGISGEHVALISGLIYWLSQWLWSRSARCCLYCPAPYVASACSLFFALFYAFLAGFEPPVQRALTGCFFYTLYRMGKKRLTAWQIWRYALFAVLCFEPHAIYMQGFYFSFLAVACLFITQQRWRLQGYRASLALQLSCLLGLMPLTLYWYSYGSINGFLANLIAIPLVGFLIVPLALGTLLLSSSTYAWIPMLPLAWLISLLLQILHGIEILAWINIEWPMPSIIMTMALMGALLLWLLIPLPHFKALALLWLSLSWFPPKAIVQRGEVLVHVLDVGQGLAVMIRTENHTLLYDTGDQFFQGSDLGKMVILPYCKAEGIKTIDAIVISHPDKDHRGGLQSIMESLPVKQLLVNEPRYYQQSGINCHHYPDWEWDKVQFHFLPITANFSDKNNRSCVLQVSTQSGKILLTGDIEKQAEDYLVRTYGANLASDVLLIPHHGSKTSSSYRFLLEVSPQYAIASLGFDNRFHFPHSQTLNSLNTLQIPFYRTDQCGMIQISLTNSHLIKPPQCLRDFKSFLQLTSYF